MPPWALPGKKVELTAKEAGQIFRISGKPSEPSALEKAVFDSAWIDPEWWASRHLLFVNKTKVEEEWPPRKLIAMIVGNIRENREALKLIRDELAANGIPVRDWVIDFREHLYDEKGGETFEPIFTHDYLHRVVKSMWKLSTTVFGTSYFTYENLADDLRDPQVARVKAAVHRIAIVDVEKKAIWTGDRNWKWLIVSPAPGKGPGYLTWETVCEFIDPLQKSGSV